MAADDEASFFSEQFGTGESSPKVIQERIRKRKPNPFCHLSSKRYAAIRFGDRGTRKTDIPAPWHAIDSKANKNGGRQLIVLDDGTEYTGDWRANLRHGRGAHCTAEGVYQGGFVDDLYEGRGQYYLWDDEAAGEHPGMWLLYTGEWRAGQYSGVGQKFEKNGDSYSGEFRRGKRCGHGVMHYHNGDRYDGQWSNDMRNGDGELTKANKDLFKGRYENDKRNGPGVLHIVSTKRRLEGIWQDDQFKCGSYYDEQDDPVYVKPDDISGTTDGMIPVLELKDPDGVLKEAMQSEGATKRKRKPVRHALKKSYLQGDPR
jgi:hypothetical protein